MKRQLLNIAFCVSLLSLVPLLVSGQARDAASYSSDISPGTLIGIFDGHVKESPQSACCFPLPKIMGNTVVFIGGKQADLLYVGPAQVNAIVPDDVVVGAVIELRTGNYYAVVGSVNRWHSPKLFSINSRGNGAPSGFSAMYFDDRVSIYRLLGQSDGTPDPIKLQSDASCYLILYATGTGMLPGMDAATSGAKVRLAGPGGVLRELTPSFAARIQPDRFVGLEQWNVLLPNDLPTGGYQIQIGYPNNGSMVWSQPLALIIEQ